MLHVLAFRHSVGPTHSPCGPARRLYRLIYTATACVLVFGVLLAPQIGAQEPESIGTEKQFKFSSLWMSQCSILGLVADGERRTFVFYKPERNERLAAKKTPILFEGSASQDRYNGKLSLLSKQCTGKRVAASGEVTNGTKRVTLTVAAADLATVCPQHPGATARVFDFLSKSIQPATTSTSVRTRNWGAVTPQVEPADYLAHNYGHILQWPTYLPAGGERDKENKIVPAFGSRVAGAGLWWHWMRVRSKFEATQRISLIDLAKRYSGRESAVDPKVQEYWERYVLYSCFYFGRRLKETDLISLGVSSERWGLAQLMFHHEAGFKVDLTRQEFESGVRLAEDFIARRMRSIREYDPNYR